MIIAIIAKSHEITVGKFYDGRNAIVGVVFASFKHRHLCRLCGLCRKVVGNNGEEGEEDEYKGVSHSCIV